MLKNLNNFAKSCFSDFFSISLHRKWFESRTNKDTKQYCEMLMDKLDEAYNNDGIEEVDKLLGMIQKLLLENNII